MKLLTQTPALLRLAMLPISDKLLSDNVQQHWVSHKPYVGCYVDQLFMLEKHFQRHRAIHHLFVVWSVWHLHHLHAEGLPNLLAFHVTCLYQCREYSHP